MWRLCVYYIINKRSFGSFMCLALLPQKLKDFKFHLSHFAIIIPVHSVHACTTVGGGGGVSFREKGVTLSATTCLQA